MQEIHNFTQLVHQASKSTRANRVAVTCPYDDDTIGAIERGLKANLADFILIGDQRMEQSLPSALCKSPKVTLHIIEDADSLTIATEAAKIVRNGDATVLMKGLINTDDFLRAILNKEFGLLEPGHLLTHLSIAQMPGYHKLLLFSDVAVIPYPTFEQRVQILKYDIDICHRLGIPHPKVALIHFTEKINPKFSNSMDYKKIVEMCNQGEFGQVTIEGPMDVKTACDSHSASVKGIPSTVSGDADLLNFPNIESGNTFYKTITLFADAIVAGILIGSSAPVVLPSRSDTIDSKYYSLAMGCLAATSV